MSGQWCMHHMPKRPKDEAEMDAQCPNLPFAVNAATLCKCSLSRLALGSWGLFNGVAWHGIESSGILLPYALSLFLGLGIIYGGDSTLNSHPRECNSRDGCIHARLIIWIRSTQSQATVCHVCGCRSIPNINSQNVEVRENAMH